MSARDKIRSDPRVRELSKEPPDGWWLYLKPGFAFGDGEAHCTSELRLSDLVKSLQLITKCNCEDCRK